MGKGLREYATFIISPFEIDGVSKVDWLRHGTDTNRDIAVNQNTGEFMEITHLGIAKEGYVDRKEFRKIYTDGIIALGDFKASGLKVLMYVLQNLQKDSDLIRLNAQVCMKELGYKTYKSFYSGLTELLEKNILAKQVGGDWFFVNPNMIFNGNRTKLYK